MTKPLRVAVTGAAGQIGYSLLPRIARGDMFGPGQPVILQLLEIPNEKAMAALKGVAMELDDCAFPLLQDIICTDDPKIAFRDADWCLLVGAKPRGPGMERADLLKDNGRIFVAQGRIIDEVAADGCRVAVVGNPANTNCMIAASQAKRLGPDRFTAMTRLDQNRAAAMLAKKAGVGINAVDDIIIYGNHSPTMYPDFFHATILGRPVPEVITDHAWLENTFISDVGKRGAAIIAARGLSSALSAANALVDHVHSLWVPSPDIHSVCIQAQEGDGYGFTPGVWASVPVITTAPGVYSIVKGIELNAFAAKAIAVTNAELVGERDTVKDMLG